MTRFPALLRQLVGIAVLGLVTIAPAAAQTDARLVGSWEVLRVVEANGEDGSDKNEGAIMTFLDDGRLLVRLISYGSDLGEEIKTTYRVESNSIVVMDPEGTERSLFYRLENTELVLSPDFSTPEVAYLRRVPEDQ